MFLFEMADSFLPNNPSFWFSSAHLPPAVLSEPFERSSFSLLSSVKPLQKDQTEGNEGNEVRGFTSRPLSLPKNLRFLCYLLLKLFDARPVSKGRQNQP